MRGPNPKFAGHIINNSLLYLSVVNDNTLSSVVPRWELQNLFEINIAIFESIVKVLNVSYRLSPLLPFILL